MNGYKRCGVDIQKVKDIVLPRLEPHHKEWIEHELNLLNTIQEENKKLNDEKHKVIQDAYNTHYETWKKEQDNITITELKEENKKLKEESEEQEVIVEYLNKEVDKYKKLFGDIKIETNKAKDVKGIIVNEDKTIISINSVELRIGDKFNVSGRMMTNFQHKFLLV